MGKTTEGSVNAGIIKMTLSEYTEKYGLPLSPHSAKAMWNAACLYGEPVEPQLDLMNTNRSMVDSIRQYASATQDALLVAAAKRIEELERRVRELEARYESEIRSGEEYWRYGE